MEKNIGYAMVPVESSDVGSTVTVATSSGDRQATVVPKPFVDPKKEVPKS
jgi:aminomethyltransferase